MGMQGRFVNRPCGMVDVDGIWIVVGATLVVALSLLAVEGETPVFPGA